MERRSQQQNGGQILDNNSDKSNISDKSFVSASEHKSFDLLMRRLEASDKNMEEYMSRLQNEDHQSDSEDHQSDSDAQNSAERDCDQQERSSAEQS